MALPGDKGAFDRLSSPSGGLARARGAVTGGAAGLVLGATLLLANLLQVLSLVVRPFSRSLFGAANRRIAGAWWGLCVRVAEVFHGTRVEITGDEIPRSENAIVLINHQSMADVTYLMFLSRAHGHIGDMKGFAKHSVKYMPGIGWGLLFLDSVFLRRSWTRDRASIERTFSRLRDGDSPFWFMIFPEGTRRTAAKQEEGNRYALQNDMGVLRYLLHPRPRGFVASVEGLGDRLDAIYDVTIAYPDGVPTLWQYMQGFTRCAGIHVARTRREDLPREPEELADWLREAYREKDRLLESYRREGRFGGAQSA